MPAWIIYALGSAFFAGLVTIFAKIGITGIDNTLATTVRAIVMALFLIILSLSLGKFSGLQSLNNKIFLFILLSGIAGALSWLCYFLALRFGQATGAASLDRLSIVFVVIFAALFLGESLTWKTALGALLISLGAIVMVF